MLPARYTDADRVLTADACAPLRAAADRREVTLRAVARGPYPGEALAEDALPGVSTVGSWDAATPQDWGLDWHCNEGIEITYMAAGSLPFATDAGTWSLRPGDVTITRPWQRHRVGDPWVTPGKLQWLIVDVGVRRPQDPWTWPRWLLADDDDRRALTEMLRGNEHPVWQADRDVEAAFARLEEAVTGDVRRRERRLALRLNEVLLALTGLVERRAPCPRTPAPSELAVRRFLEELPARVGEPWTLDSMAAACGLGRTRFAAHCRALTNATPLRHLTACRVQHAGVLLADPDVTVTEAAHAAGFRSSQHFATVFRRMTGERPREFARRTRSR